MIIYSKQSSIPTTPTKMKIKMTEAERKRKYRAQKSAEKKAADQATDRARKAAARANMTEEQREEAQEADRARMREARENMPEEEREQVQEEDTVRRREARENMTEEQREQVQEANRGPNTIRRRKARENMPEEQRRQIQATDKNNKAAKSTDVKFKEAMKSKEILDGSYLVEEFNIGAMDQECDFCGALKFRRETASTCCNKGKVLGPTDESTMKPFPKPTPKINALWHDNTADGRLFRQHSRSFNNAVCMTSLKINERNQGYTPSVIFHGKVHHKIGPLLPAPNETPRFAQLYVHDPSQEDTNRFNNMYIPANTTYPQKERLRKILKTVQEELHQHNPFIKDFKQIMELPEQDLQHGQIVVSANKRPDGEHERRYNTQANLNEVSILTNSEPHDLVIQKRGGGLQDVHEMNPKGMPLHFTLLFPKGTFGWDPANLKHKDGRRRVTPKEFFAYHLNIRNEVNGNYLHHAGRLFQEWICMGWVLTENQRLNYQSQNQKALRADTYKNVQQATDERREELRADLAPREDNLYRDDNERPAIGRKILSSSFSGSPRWYNAKFQDAMAICKKFHKPDFFITMTCNPHWPEIQAELKEGQKAQDRPDLVARVFKEKKDQLLKDLKAGGIFGKSVADLHVIEFQKRGLPHAHILIILANQDRPLTSELVDGAVCAELPPSPDDTNDPVKKKEREILQKIVLANMIHGPCGADNPSQACMENGRCTKGFPKEFNKHTIVDPSSNYATYQRRSPEDGGRTVVCPKTGRVIDNSWVVPYNPFLSKRYNCHINMEVCTSPKCAKYLYKYTLKGSDRAMVATVVPGQEGQPRDEITEYVDLRSVGSSEAVWHLLGFPITDRHPPVTALRLHLEDQQQVVFDEGTEDEALENQRTTELTEFFELNKKLKDDDPDVDIEMLPQYVDMPSLYRYDKPNKKWIKRKRNLNENIGRVHTVNPVAGDVFYLRILLHNDHCRGKISFKDLMTLPSGRVCGSYKEVCCELGLLADDLEWQRVLEESAATKMCPQIRELYITILLFCFPSNPRALYDEFWPTWVDDYEHKGRRNGITLDEQQLQTMLLLDLETRLQSWEKQLTEFGLPVPTPEELARVENITNTEPAVIRDEMAYDIQELAASVEETVPRFTRDQAKIYNEIMDAVREEKPLLAFIDARGGCGKTFLLNAILRGVRSHESGGCVALAMGTTGIAANLLDLGRTFHSRMKAPLTPAKDSMLGISGQSSLTKLIGMAKLLMIDEATMLDGWMLEAMDRTLRDILRKPDDPFGGKTLVLAGDFRQCLPVVPGATRAGTVKHCINQSELWGLFTVLKLTENMRVKASGDPLLEDFDKWTLSITRGNCHKN